MERKKRRPNPPKKNPPQKKSTKFSWKVNQPQPPPQKKKWLVGVGPIKNDIKKTGETHKPQELWCSMPQLHWSLLRVTRQLWPRPIPPAALGTVVKIFGMAPDMVHGCYLETFRFGPWGGKISQIFPDPNRRKLSGRWKTP